MAENPTIPLIRTREGAITKLTGDGLTGPNWVTWRVRMWSLLALCEVEAYVCREIPQPARDVDPVGHDNWKKNDNYAKHLITQNVADEPLVHIQHSSSSHTAWHNLDSSEQSMRTKARRPPLPLSETSGILLPKRGMTLANTL